MFDIVFTGADCKILAFYAFGEIWKDRWNIADNSKSLVVR